MRMREGWIFGGIVLAFSIALISSNGVMASEPEQLSSAEAEIVEETEENVEEVPDTPDESSIEYRYSKEVLFESTPVKGGSVKLDITLQYREGADEAFSDVDSESYYYVLDVSAEGLLNVVDKDGAEILPGTRIDPKDLPLTVTRLSYEDAVITFCAYSSTSEEACAPLKDDLEYTFTNSDVDDQGIHDYYISDDNFYCRYDDTQFTDTGFAYVDGIYYYLTDGKWDSAYCDFVKPKNISGCDGEIWYVENGQVKFDKNSVIKDAAGTLGTKGAGYYVVGSKVQTGYTGVANHKNENGWWYIKNGAVDLSYTGFSSNKNGDWYVEKGQVKFDKNSVIKDAAGALGKKGVWYYVAGSKVQTGYTGVANYKNENGWWYIKNGKVDFTHTGVEKNKNGWWRVEKGKVNFKFNGFAQNQNGWWYLEKGKVGFNKTDVMKAKINGKSGWWYVKKSQVMFVDTVAKNANGWWRIENGKVNFNFNGFAENQNGWWYLTAGKVRFGTNSVIKGKVNGETAWWYVKGGKVILNYSGIGINDNGVWLIEKGKVNFDFTGEKVIDGVTCHFTNGRTYDYYNGWVIISNKYYYYVNGKKKANCIVDGYKIDANGYSETKTLVCDIVNSQTTAAMTNDKKIEVLWNWLIYNSWTYTRTYEHTSSSWTWYSGWTDDFAKQCIKNKSGNCFRYAALFGYMVKEATGYQVRGYHGMTPASRGGTTPHGWITVNIGGTWYAYDPDLYKFSTKRSIYYKTPYATTSRSIHLQGSAVDL